MDSYQFEIIEHFSSRLHLIIKFRHLIHKVAIDTNLQESHKRRYYAVNINVVPRENYKEGLSLEENAGIEKLLKSDPWQPEEEQPVAYIIYSANPGDINYGDEQYFNQVRKFADNYYTLCSFFAAFLAKAAPGITLYIHSLDKYPEINYCRRFWEDQKMTHADYQDSYKTKLETDINQFFSLYSLRKEPGELKKVLLIEDKEFPPQTDISVNQIRALAHNYHVPYLIEGNKTVDCMRIDAAALKTVIQNKKITMVSEKALGYLDWFLTQKLREEAAHKKRQRKFILQEKDVILLKNGKVARITEIKKGKEQTLCYYKPFNKMCHEGPREAFCNPVEQVLSVLPAKEYEMLNPRFKLAPYKQLERHMQRLRPIDWTRHAKK